MSDENKNSDPNVLLGQLEELLLGDKATEEHPYVEVFLSPDQSCVVTREAFKVAKTVLNRLRMSEESNPAAFIVSCLLDSAPKSDTGRSEEEILAEKAKFVEAMKTAAVRTIVDDGEIGVDINGESFDIKDMVLVNSYEYPSSDAFTVMENEVGTMFDPEGSRQAVRLIRVGVGVDEYARTQTGT